MNENKANRVLRLEQKQTASLNDEQKQLKKTGERISKQMQLFDYALQRGKKGDYADVRKSEI